MSLQPILIAGELSGLTNNVKPWLVPDQAFTTLENAYVYRDRVVKRECLTLLGRLQRIFTAINGFPITITAAGPNLINLLNVSSFISTITPGTPTIITTTYPHGLTSGDNVIITGVLGTMAASVNDISYTVTVITPTTFSIAVNTTGLTYTSGGFVFSNRRLSNQGQISAANNANPGQITTTFAHGLVNGDQVVVTGVVGATGYNNQIFSITVVDPTNFTVGVDATLFGAYVSGGFWKSLTSSSFSEPNSEVAEGNSSLSLIIVVGPQTLTDSTGTGVFVISGAGDITAATINYTTGVISITSSGTAGPLAVTMTYSYYPSLPVMEIAQREQNYINVEQAVVFDTKYAYTWNGSSFNEYIPGTIWAGTDHNGYWTSNFTAGSATTTARFFFVTNFVQTDANPVRYTSNGSSWINFAPQLDTVPNFLYQGLIILPYYGRLIYLNTWEGPTSLGTNTTLNYYNRCRFSAIGDPTLSTAWRTDIPGKGGFIDAPTNEAIIGAGYFKNTLIVKFENSTWRLTYNGEYGLPFLWERISSDFGSVSTFGTITFDEGLLDIGDKAITSSTDLKVDRIDGVIPDQIFDFQNENNGPQRVQGVRDFRRELAFWTFVDSNSQNTGGTFPNRVLVYNYRNNTFAIFRDNVTAFGTFQSVLTENAINWDSQIITWDSEETTWDDPDNQSNFPWVMAGNQQGFVHYYGQQKTPDDGSLSITAVSLVGPTVQLTIYNHNLEDGDIIYLQNLMFLNGSVVAPNGLNGNIYRVKVILNSGLTDPNNIVLEQFDPVSQLYFTNITAGPGLVGLTYVGSGTVALFPVMDIITKDFNPYMSEGKQMKISSIDFMTEVSDTSAITVNLFANAQQGEVGNLPLGNLEVETSIVTPYYPDFPSQYAWHRFYATLFGQFLRIEITYDDTLMNTYATHEESFELNGIRLNIRPGGHLVF